MPTKNIDDYPGSDESFRQGYARGVIDTDEGHAWQREEDLRVRFLMVDAREEVEAARAMAIVDRDKALAVAEHADRQRVAAELRAAAAETWRFHALGSLMPSKAISEMPALEMPPKAIADVPKLHVLAPDSLVFVEATQEDITSAGYTPDAEVMAILDQGIAALAACKAETAAIIAFEPIVRELLQMAFSSPLMTTEREHRLITAIDTMYADSPPAPARTRETREAPHA